MPARAVIGRDAELAAIEAFLGDVEQGPTALVLSGEPGIGKTILWEKGVEAARGSFGYVLSHRSVEAEALLSFAGLSDLLEEVLDDVGRSLLRPRRRALEVALLIAEPGDETPDPRAIGLAVRDVLQVLGERAPVLVALDDVQWLDSASAVVLQVALRRLREERVGFLASLRYAPELAASFELAQAFSEKQLKRVSLGPLSLGALHHLLKERLQLELTRPELARVRETSGGNPFFALELGRELVRQGARLEPSCPLPVPSNLGKLLGARLARLSPETRQLLLIAAATGRRTSEVVVAAHGDRERALDALEVAAGEGMVELDGSRIRFAHPLLASVCYEQALPLQRRAAHRALAAVVDDAEERARHLALAADRPDARIASELDAAADRAAARGAPATAAEVCELAAELTPDDPAVARQRRLQAASLYSLAGDPNRAASLLDQLLTEVPSGPERADVLFARVSTFRGNNALLLDLCDEALVEAPGDNIRSARILAYRIWLHLLKGDVPASLADAQAALEKAERAGDPILLASTIGRAAQAEMWAAEVTPGLLERGAEIEERLGLPLDYRTSPRLYLARLLMRQGEIDRSRTLAEELEATAAARGDETTRMTILWHLSMVEWLAGRWQRAIDLAAEAQELAEQIMHTGWTGRVKGLVEADLGLVEQARGSAEEGLAHSRAMSVEVHVIIGLGVLGRLELALGNLEAAGDYLRDLPERLLAGGMKDPTQPVWADAIETLIALGELGKACAYLEQYELNAKSLGSPFAVAGAARCRGLLSAAEGDLSAATATFENSLADTAPFPLERGRTLLCLGSAQRQAQQKKAARETLQQALAIFEELGARLWAEKAHAELRRISGRSPASDKLTETERRVAELAARGRTNKQIAAELYMGLSTVEAHLSHVYRKLGVRRAELAAQLAAVQGEPV
jgi:DNA-binding CsgD family transcriptional regulator/Cdc6-like AAA superfamily ATPase